MISMFLTQTVFLGIFIGAFDITAHSLLLTTFDEKMMARGYVISGFAGILITLLYSRLQRTVHFSNLAFINLLIAGVVTFFLWCLLIFSPQKWMIFLVFILLGPLNFMMLSVFRGTTDRLAAGQKENKIFRIPDIGLISGIMIISFVVPVLMLFKLQSRDLLLISASSVLVAAVIQRLTLTRFSLVEIETDGFPEEHDKAITQLVHLRKDPLIRMLGAFAGLSVLTVFFIQYSFMAVTRVQYPVAEDMAGFLGFLTGGMMIILLFFKLVAYPFILRNYGLRYCLLIPPLLIAAITALAVLSGSILGYTPGASGGFLIFFVLLALSRVFSKSLKDSIEIASFKVFYQSIKEEMRLGLESAMNGTFNETAMLISGIILIIPGLFGFIKIVHFSIILLIISIIWIVTAFRLFIEYRNSIIKVTETDIPEVSSIDRSKKQNDLNNRFSARIDFKTDYFSLISGNYSALSTVSNKFYFEEIIDYAYSKKDINLLPLLKKASNNLRLDEEVRQHSADVVELLQKNSASSDYGDEKINEAIKVLAGTRMPQTTEVLRLLRDKSIESKRLAIYMIGKFRLNDLLSEVCECLIVPGLANDSAEVLKTFGDYAEDVLMRYYLRTSGNIRLSKIVLRLLGRTCTKETMEFLFSRLWANSRQLKEVALKCLIDCRFRPMGGEKQRLDQLISDVIGIISWNISARVVFERDEDNFLLEKIIREIDRWYKFLFDLLSLTYDSRAIERIRENVEKKTEESSTNAVEMTSLIVSESIRSKLISLFNVLYDEDRIKELFYLFPGEVPARKKLLEDIINCDYNLLSLWTKACTLRSICRLEGNDMAESVTALLFSPEELIQEEAANLMARSDPELYRSVSGRIPDSMKTRLDSIVNGTIDKKEYLFEKLLFLTKYFRGIPEDDLLPVACELQYSKNFEREFPGSSGGHIIWVMDGYNQRNEVHIAYNGVIDGLARTFETGQHLSFYFLPLDAVEEYHFQYPDNSDEILKFIESSEQ